MKAQAKRRLICAVKSLIASILLLVFDFTLVFKTHPNFLLVKFLFYFICFISTILSIYGFRQTYYNFCAFEVLIWGYILEQKEKQGYMLTPDEQELLQEAFDIFELCLSIEYDEYSNGS